MNDNYLWDGSGEPDPEIQRLENTLGRFRHNRPAPDFRALTQATLTLPAPRRVRISFIAAFAGLAAAALLAVGSRRIREFSAPDINQPVGLECFYEGRRPANRRKHDRHQRGDRTSASRRNARDRPELPRDHL